eukprot:TRINITY_DN11057_c0_g1_i3.p3 TRINITY_DN11057_c0_g1~~TRINITY_DN11057_c0_g1_i3.p3  ORF type:complete len:107 (+),score=22.64 TRINITY_DN11057_c0_g1_i3:175-495(+)
MSSLPTLLRQMKELSSMPKCGRRGGSDDVPGKTSDSQGPTLLACSHWRKDPKNFQKDCAAGPSARQRNAEGERKFSSEPPNPALSALQFFRARQEHIASRKAAFVV